VVQIRPRAEAILSEQFAQSRVDPSYVAKRSVFVMLKEYEPEVCVILMIWSLALLVYRGVANTRQRRMLAHGLLSVPPGMRILPKDTREYARQLESLPASVKQLLLPRASVAALERFGTTANIHDAAEAGRAVCESEAERLDSELSMLRYIAWAIPAIGFIGTVRGIGDALAEAHKAVTGDISGVTEGLGTAFNSTLVALLLSLVLMFLLHQLQLAQERLVLDAETYLDNRLLRNLQVR
jgi:biopolymer transport protein ExbB/TolQ